MTRSPIFIGGMFKSGTTLLRAMLSQHSAIASGLETYWFDWDWRQSMGAEVGEALGRLDGYFDLDRSMIDSMAKAAPTPEAFLDLLMVAVAAREGKPRWAEKTPGNIAHLDRIWTAWPEAQVIQILRDPRDVFASLVEARKWDTAEAFATRWCATVGASETLLATLKPDSDRYLLVRYEDLVGAPEATMRQVLDFTGESWEPKVAIFAGRDADFDKVREATGKESSTLARLKEPLGAQRVRIWPRVLDGQQVEQIRDEVRSRGFGELYDRIISDRYANRS